MHVLNDCSWNAAVFVALFGGRPEGRPGGEGCRGRAQSEVQEEGANFCQLQTFTRQMCDAGCIIILIYPQHCRLPL